MRIAVVLIERTLPGMQELMAAIRKEFRAQVTRAHVMDLPPLRAYRKSRNQFDAKALLRGLGRWNGADCTMFVFREDLFVPGLNFVFGLAEGNRAIVSTARLDPRFYGETDLKKAGELFRHRLIKESLHELGHTLGLPHCENKTCVMSFSNSVGDVDAKGEDFCANCMKLLDAKRKDEGLK